MDTRDTRRDFIKKAAFFSGAGMWAGLHASIEKAFAIAPDPGSTFLDAEHVVILMQENRSFDHCFGTLRGVRGFNDPRAISLPNGNPVWVQTSDDGASYVPFRLNIKDTNATWMGSLPHSWTDQVDARNGGRHDRWLQAKASGHDAYAKMPLTLGYYNRDDIPFYYALADAFTVCDQNFCSSLTGTTPNRLYLWTGTIRSEPKPEAWANVLNSDVSYGSEASWKTYPERLEEHGVSWKIYQNELSIATELNGEAEAWLANFTDNPIEWFTQYHVRFADGHRQLLDRTARALTGEIESMEKELAGKKPSAKQERELAQKKARRDDVEKERQRWSAERFEKLPLRERQIHAKAFTTNREDPSYHELAELDYVDGDKSRRMKIPKGDVLHQFRSDVENGNLPTVSWLVPPERFSDHPGSPWYGAWYLSEVLDILTKRPEVWKKTVFILTYDENDGYFDHVPPFAPPHPTKEETGRVSDGIDPAVEYVELQQELTRKSPGDSRDNSIGLGYRVPMIIASPWSRGGCVCSQVFDHTSPLQFLEVLLRHKTGKNIRESNISAWRRTVCGDLTSVFQEATSDEPVKLPFHDRDEFFEGIHRAQFKSPPDGFRELTTAEIEQMRKAPSTARVMPRQEAGRRPSAPLPYELVVDGKLGDVGKRLRIDFEARNERFGDRSSGAPFIAFARRGGDDVQIRNYAVAAGDRISDEWNLSDFGQNVYDVAVYGPNGFYRQFRGGPDDPSIEVSLIERGAVPIGAVATGDLEVVVFNRDRRAHAIAIADNSYGGATIEQVLGAGERATLAWNTLPSAHWYDLSLFVDGFANFEKRYAGRIETGEWGSSDPALG